MLSNEKIRMNKTERKVNSSSMFSPFSRIPLAELRIRIFALRDLDNAKRSFSTVALSSLRDDMEGELKNEMGNEERKKERKEIKKKRRKEREGKNIRDEGTEAAGSSSSDRRVERLLPSSSSPISKKRNQN